MVFTHNQHIGSLYGKKRKRHGHSPILKLSFNDCGCCIMHNPRAVIWLLSIIEGLTAFTGNMVNDDVASPGNER